MVRRREMLLICSNFGADGRDSCCSARVERVNMSLEDWLLLKVAIGISPGLMRVHVVKGRISSRYVPLWSLQRPLI
jgi:hypothetical protein